jgi:hypothetical protein
MILMYFITANGLGAFKYDDVAGWPLVPAGVGF